MRKLKINLFGEGIKISRLLIRDEDKQVVFNEMLQLNAHQFNDAIQADSFSEIIDSTLRQIVLNGLSNTYKNQIEIWYGGKKIQKLKLVDLNPQFSLFPLYQTTSTEFVLHQLAHGIYCEEKEIGLIACYETILENFNIQELEFETKIMENTLVLLGLTYKGVTLKSIKSDTLLTSQFYFQRES